MKIDIQKKVDVNCRKCYGWGLVTGGIIDHDEDYNPVYEDVDCDCVKSVVYVNGVELEELLSNLGYKG